jgi:hypothetical protein
MVVVAGAMKVLILSPIVEVEATNALHAEAIVGSC